MNTTFEKKIAYFSLFTAACVMSACGPKEEPTSMTPVDMGRLDASMDLATLPDMETDEGIDEPDMMVLDASMPDLEVCEPLTECPTDVCGDIPDGCGGTLTCEPCACAGGVPSTPTCGVCGLGRTRCESETEVVCDEPPLELERLDCITQVIYVDASYQGFSSGSKQEPYTTLEEARATAQASPGVRVAVMREGRYTNTSMSVSDGLSLVGGYAQGWVYNPDGRSELIFEGHDDRFSYGLDFTNNAGFSLLAHVYVETTQAPESSVYTTPVQIRYSRNVNLFDVETFAASGSAGLDGEDGMDGLNGADGGDAGRRPNNDPANFAQPGLPSMDDATTCPNTTGGVGGEGGISGRGARDGGAPLNYPAQEGGRGSEVQNHPNGYDGGDGFSMAGMLLAAPAPTTGVGQWLPVGMNGQFVWSANTQGADGMDGLDGGGGTGGGGGILDMISSNNMTQTYTGGSGGAGGNGGCGGQGGKGGQGGGSSFGLVVIDSPTTRITNSNFRARSGGNGGDPGQGGQGGTGGNGGEGTPTPFENAGGDGGTGGAGQDGAEGAPGAGGSSIGALCQSPVLWTASTGRAATPGRGGRASTSNAEGATGQTFTELGCQP